MAESCGLDSPGAYRIESQEFPEYIENWYQCQKRPSSLLHNRVDLGTISGY